MNNNQKKTFITNYHKLCIRYNIPYGITCSKEQLYENDSKLWEEFKKSLLHSQPKYLYKYRKVDEYSIENLKNDTVWFSHPSKFDDTLDTSINIDIKQEMKEFQQNEMLYYRRLSIAMIYKFFKDKKIKFKDDMDSLVKTYLTYFDEEGRLDRYKSFRYLKLHYPKLTINQINQINEIISTPLNKETEEAISGYLSNFLNINSKIKSEACTFCLAEENDNSAMWGTYADNSQGFCIEYEIPADDISAQRMRINLLPIYYGKKRQFKFFDFLVEGLYSLDKDTIYGISKKDYRNIFLSLYTKSLEWLFQKEWRIVLGKEVTEKNVHFPYARSIILGERISKKNEQTLIDIARSKRLKIYKRKFNESQSKIVIEEIEYID